MRWIDGYHVLNYGTLFPAGRLGELFLVTNKSVITSIEGIRNLEDANESMGIVK
jgi:hypothetical protein